MILNLSALLDKFQQDNPSTIEAGGADAKAAVLALALVQPRGGSSGKIQIFDNETQALRDIAAEDLPTAYTEQAAELVTILGADDDDATLTLSADLAAQTADSWSLVSKASGNTLQFLNGSTLIFHAVSTGLVVAANMNVTCAAGTTALDLSLGTGVFKTPSGVNTISGTVSLAANKDIACVAGTTAVDFSLGTGIFKTSSGANTLSGDTTVAANKDLLFTTGDSAADFSLGTGVTKTTTGRFTIGGYTTFKNTTVAVAAAGSTVADAGQLGASNIVHITSDGATKGVKLQTGVAGDVVDIINDSATAAELYAASGGTVNGLAADASVVIPASKGLRCFCTAADTWIAFDMPALATAS